MGLQVGAITPAFYGFRDREYVLNLIEAVTGGRFHPNFNRIGGIKDDLPWGWISRVPPRDEQGARVVRRVRRSRRRQPDLPEAHAFDRHHPAGAGRRVRRVGLEPARVGRRLGPATRRSKYLVYNELDWQVWTHPDGDSFARYWVRLQETRESARMVLQMLDQMPSGPLDGQGAAHHQGAGGRGVREHREPARRDGLLRHLEGRDRTFRTKIRTASFSNVSILPWLLKGVYVPDIVTILASLYFILGDIDR